MAKFTQELVDQLTRAAQAVAKHHIDIVDHERTLDGASDRAERKQLGSRLETARELADAALAEASEAVADMLGYKRPRAGDPKGSEPKA